jgi:hypothetical protein
MQEANCPLMSLHSIFLWVCRKPKYKCVTVNTIDEWFLILPNADEIHQANEKQNWLRVDDNDSF